MKKMQKKVFSCMTQRVKYGGKPVPCLKFWRIIPLVCKLHQVNAAGETGRGMRCSPRTGRKKSTHGLLISKKQDSHSSSQKKQHVNTFSRSDSVCQDISVLRKLLVASQIALAAIKDWYISDLEHEHHLEKKNCLPVILNCINSVRIPFFFVFLVPLRTCFFE